jgi:ribosomal protein S27E
MIDEEKDLEKANELYKEMADKMKFEIPHLELYCEKCDTSNFIYSDMKPPYKCDDCGSFLEIDEGRYDGEV